jgi:hypothetical protein
VLKVYATLLLQLHVRNAITVANNTTSGCCFRCC